MRNGVMIVSCFISFIICTSAGVHVKKPIKKIHAYKQAVIPGIIQKHFDEKGNEIEPDLQPAYNYWFYIETARSEKIYVADCWISGKRFLVKNELISKTPVKKIIYTASNGPDTVSLVPGTKNRVILVYPSGLLKNATTGSRYVSGLIKNSELVIGYFWKGKKYFAPVKKLVNLQPDVHE